MQLALVGRLDDFETGFFRLPARLTQFGATTIGGRIYIAGGLTFETPASTEGETIGNVWSGEVRLTPGENGEPPDGNTLIITDETDEQGWRDELPLPDVTYNSVPQFATDVVSPSQSIAMTALDNPTGNDYIYIIGGNTGTNDGRTALSMNTVRIGVVNGTTGRITRWITSNGDNAGMTIPGPRIDIPQAQRFGLASPSITIVEAGGTHYLYLFGGEAIDPNNLNDPAPGSNRAYYARIGSNGRLYRPDTTEDTTDTLGWERLPDIPLEPARQVSGVQALRLGNPM
ncbi:MAG: hypothetical protein HC893_08550 [Chloroflexaceae bacterium]|nr:hypothetical protein [Chloroflexaceae bacterium]